MSIRGTVGSLLESHRAKCSHPDRRNFIPQTGRLPSAAQFSGRLPQLRSTVPNSPPAAPQFPDDHPHFPGGAPQCKSHRPHFFSRRHRFQWSVPQPFMQNCRQKVAKSAKTNPHPSCRTPSPIGWERDGVRAAISSPQLRTANSQLLKS